LEVRAELKRLFIQYCEFKEETAEAHITHEGAKKLLRDAGLPSSRQLEMVLMKTFKHKGTIEFEEFLNLQLEVAEALDPRGY
jgi:Ca2+-binding EF-hand superfamily protein